MPQTPAHAEVRGKSFNGSNTSVNRRAIVPEANGLSRLRILTAGDLIGPDVISIPAAFTMTQAARTLSSNRIGLTPVVDKVGCCIGVLSAKDFVTFEIVRNGEQTPAKRPNLAPRGTFQDWDSVRRFMSTAVQTVPFDAPLERVAEIMCAEHIHHLVVLDEQARPIGVVSSLDVLAALVAIVEEERRDLHVQKSVPVMAQAL
jgi:CBS-domain-containing membrane protein